MTAFDRIERRLPELMEELAPASLPDYFDDMLHATARSRQRPAWSSLERWLPMGVIARPLPLRPVPWRLIAIVAAIGLLGAATLIYAGNQRRVPAPFGPAVNGAVVIGTADGDLATVDLATGTITALIGGSTFDTGPYFSNDGQRFVFDRAAAAGEAPKLHIANADGSGARELFPGVTFDYFEWAPSGHHAILTQVVGGKRSVSIVNVDDGSSTDLAMDLDVAIAMPRPGTDQLLIAAGPENDRTFWLVDMDGTRRVQLSTVPFANNEPTMSPDGTRFAYTTWIDGDQGVIHILDFATDSTRRLTGGVDGFIFLNPQFSPDGKQLVAERFLGGSDPAVAQVAVIRVDGNGSSVAMGPMSENPQPQRSFSPDGTKIVATYADGTTWVFDSDGRNGKKQSWSAPAGLSWQRVAR